MNVEKSGVWRAGSALLFIMVGGVYAQEATDETVEGGGYGGRATHMGNTLVQLHRLHFCA